ncbi:MAG: abortive infection system antitoxin AbiGi family protein [Pyrinomonadaceae bacterium]
MEPTNTRGLSANTLFHFTSSLENLINILTEEFHAHFCLENVSLLVGLKELEVAIPMVSFCDIPLSQTAFHLSVYGDYGIGMTKSWGKRNGISPVLYTYDNSLMVTRFTRMMDSVMKDLPKQTEDEAIPLVFDFASFVKPYEGALWRIGGTLDNIRFYDEREWRFVPNLPKDFEPLFLGKPSFLSEESRSKANLAVRELSRLSFEPNDIQYLIVRREDEIVPLIKQVQMKKSKYAYDDVLLLSSRIISAEQIGMDF